MTLTATKLGDVFLEHLSKDVNLLFGLLADLACPEVVVKQQVVVLCDAGVHRGAKQERQEQAAHGTRTSPTQYYYDSGLQCIVLSFVLTRILLKAHGARSKP